MVGNALTIASECTSYGNTLTKYGCTFITQCITIFCLIPARLMRGIFRFYFYLCILCGESQLFFMGLASTM